jgi:hypothetical protein
VRPHVSLAVHTPARSALFCAPVLLWSQPHAQDLLNAWATAPHALVKLTTARQSRALAQADGRLTGRADTPVAGVMLG